MFTPVRWKQRFQNLEKAADLLFRIAAVEKPSDGEKMGLIQAFEMTFELAWKTLQDYLINQGFVEFKGPREVIKQALQSGIILDGHIWLDMLEKRNLTVHIYDSKRAEEIDQKIRQDYLGCLRSVVEYFKQEYGE